MTIGSALLRETRIEGPTRSRRTLATVIVAIAGLVAVGQAVAAGFVLGIAGAAQLAGGSRVVVSGSVSCASRDQLRLRAAVIERSTGAYAEGTSYRRGAKPIVCSGGNDHWTISVASKTGPRFKRGPAEICVLGTTRRRKIGFTNLVESCKAVRLILAG